MAQTPTAFDTTVLVNLDSDNGMKYKMPRHGPHTPWSPIRNPRNGDHARRPSPPSDLEDCDDALAGNVESVATATVYKKHPRLVGRLESGVRVLVPFLKFMFQRPGVMPKRGGKLSGGDMPGREVSRRMRE